MQHSDNSFQAFVQSHSLHGLLDEQSLLRADKTLCTLLQNNSASVKTIARLDNAMLWLNTISHHYFLRDQGQLESSLLWKADNTPVVWLHQETTLLQVELQVLHHYCVAQRDPELLSLFLEDYLENVRPHLRAEVAIHYRLHLSPELSPHT
jgi:hypothetical protein